MLSAFCCVELKDRDLASLSKCAAVEGDLADVAFFPRSWRGVTLDDCLEDDALESAGLTVASGDVLAEKVRDQLRQGIAGEFLGAPPDFGVVRSYVDGSSGWGFGWVPPLCKWHVSYYTYTWPGMQLASVAAPWRWCLTSYLGTSILWLDGKPST